VLITYVFVMFNATPCPNPAIRLNLASPSWRKYLLYLAFSLGFHGCLLLAFSFWKVAREPQPEQRVVLLEVRNLMPRQARPGERSSAPAPGSNLIGGLAVPEPGALGVLPAEPHASRALRAGVKIAATEPAPIERSEKPRLAERSDTLSFPSPAETLLKALSGNALEPIPPAPAAAEVEGGYTQETALEWKGRQRQLLRSLQLSFPELLAEKGLEVDVEAAFAVAPSGQVIRVEITRSSGFASVDRAVEQAMYNTLFEASSGEAEDQGRIRLHFRLERKQ
jgi:TonB family protein